jgi:hypothetical protein
MAATVKEARQEATPAPDVKRPAEASADAPTAFLDAQALLDEDTADALLERAAILEYDAGLPRAEAEREALALYRVHLDGDDSEDAKHAPDAPTPRLEGLDAILYLAGRGIRLIGCYESGASIGKGEDYAAAFTTDAETVAALWNGTGDTAGRARGTPIRRFRFVPADAGLLCLDLDRGHEDGGDGLAAFLDLFKREGQLLPAYFADLENGSFPAWTRTPSGGLHLYFKYRGARRYPHQYLAPDVEAFHTGNALTAPGSAKASGPYVFTGDLDAAPILPPIIERRLTPVPSSSAAAAAPRPVFTFDRRPGPPPLDLIAQWARDDGRHGGSRNRLCFEIARRAARDGYDYSAAAVSAFLRGLPDVAGLPEREIDTAVASAFKGK